MRLNRLGIVLAILGGSPILAQEKIPPAAYKVTVEHVGGSAGTKTSDNVALTWDVKINAKSTWTLKRTEKSPSGVWLYEGTATDSGTFSLSFVAKDVGPGPGADKCTHTYSTAGNKVERDRQPLMTMYFEAGRLYWETRSVAYFYSPGLLKLECPTESLTQNLAWPWGLEETFQREFASDIVEFRGSVAKDMGALMPRRGIVVNVTTTYNAVPLCAVPETASLSTSATGTAGEIDVNASPGCPWTAGSTQPWVQVYPLGGTGASKLRYTIFPNFSSTARTATVTASGRTLQITQAANPATRDERFVEMQYFSFFGRLPTTAERGFQVTQGLKPPATYADLTINFLNSMEFNNGGRFVAGVYVGLLDRDAEYGGWLFQRNALATNVVTQDSLVANFLYSVEYALRFGTPDNREFVRLLYRYILLREASQAEVTFQASLLATDTTRVALARNFLNSNEFRNGTGPRLTSFLLYATLLLRDPTLAERTIRVGQLTSGVPVKNIVFEFVESPEFVTLLK